MAEPEQLMLPDFPPPDPPHELAGKPYRPETEEEWEGFERKFCDHCDVDPECYGSCPILFRASTAPIDDADFPKEMTHDYRGRPICTGFDEREG